jgi:membrane protease YdiL (CAAX protease family)
MNAVASFDKAGAQIDPAESAWRGAWLFFVLTLGLMALLGGLAVLGAQGLVALPLPPLALTALGGFGPLLVGLGLTAREAGRPGWRALLAQLAPGRVRPVWYAVVLLGMAAVVFAALLLGRALGAPWPSAPPAAVWGTLPLLAAVYVVLAMVEEVGWRGYAQPRLQARIGALRASLLIGLVWGLWHLPQWLIPATGQAEKWPFPVFLAHAVAFSVLLAGLYNRTGGGLLSIVLAHAAYNLYPEPWAAAWALLPVDARGPYPVVLITAVLVSLAAALALLADPATLTHRRREE